MQCTHRFYQECIDNFAAAQKMAVIELRCPTCKTPPCSDEDALVHLEKLNQTLNTMVNLPDEPMQAINLEDTQEYATVDLDDTSGTAVDLVDTADPEGAGSTEPAEDSSQGSDLAPLLEVTAREQKRRLDAGLRTEPIAKKAKAPPSKTASTRIQTPPSKAHPLNAIAEANFQSRKEAYAREKMAKALGAHQPRISPAKAKAQVVGFGISQPKLFAKPTAVGPKPKPAVEPTAAAKPKLISPVRPTAAAEPKPSPAAPKTPPVMPKPSKSTVVMVAESMHVPNPKPTCSTAPSEAPQLLQCDLCGSCVSRDLARVHSKKAETYKCGKCSSVMTALYRRPGGLPSDKLWSTEKRNEFWQTMQTQHNAASMDEVTNRFTQSEFKKDESHYDNSGEFLPLSVWAQRGFNTESIETNSSDSNIRFDPVLGKIYRVVIQSSGHRGAHGTEEQRQHCLAPGAPGATATRQPSTLNELKAEVEKVESTQKAEELQAKLQTRKIANLRDLCNQLTSMCNKNPEMVPNNITVQADRLAQETDEIKIQALTSDVTKASPYLSLYLSIYI